MSSIIERMYSDTSDTAWKQTSMSSELEIRNRIWLEHFVVIEARIEDYIVSQIYEDLEDA